MNAVLFLNGDPGTAFRPSEYRDSFVVCADGAYRFVHTSLTPDLIMGDMDSLDIKEIPEEIATLVFPEKKDYTDGQLAVRYLAERGYRHIKILGAFGGRPDQAYVNYSLLKLADTLGVAAEIEGDGYFVFYVKNRYQGVAEKNKTISIVPYGSRIHILYTKGLEYPAIGLDVDNSLITSISNKATGGEFSFEISGEALLFVEK